MVPAPLSLSMILTASGTPLRASESPIPSPGPGEALVEQQVVGVNFVDLYHWHGLYPLPPLPVPLGVEAAGIVRAVGAGGEDLRPGDRVAYALPVGAYTHWRCVPAARLVPVPEFMPLEQAAAGLLKGLTAHMLFSAVRLVAPGETVLIHAAGGGLGQILVGWAKRRGAVVIGTAGSPDKAAKATRAGADHVILYRDEDFVAAVRAATGGQGVAFAIDGVGGKTLARTLDCVHPFGAVASIGQAEGPIPPVDVGDLGPKRSLALWRPSVFGYAADTARYRGAAAAVLKELAGAPVDIGATYPLAEAQAALTALEAGRTAGSVLLRPGEGAHP